MNITKTDNGWTIAGVEGTFKSRAGARAEVARMKAEAESPEVADMTEEFAADAEAEEIPEPTAEVADSTILEALRIAAAADDKADRNRLVLAARAAKIRRSEIAEAAGVSINYLQHIISPQPRRQSERTPRLTSDDRDVLFAASLALYGIDITLPEAQRSLDPEVMARLTEILIAQGQITPESA